MNKKDKRLEKKHFYKNVQYYRRKKKIKTEKNKEKEQKNSLKLQHFNLFHIRICNELFNYNIFKATSKSRAMGFSMDNLYFVVF